ncbi:MAG: chemotaxis protein CheW [Candidatus Thiodiazotropha taylori]|nr:chemotaxis protein CheW [Candidatus Thiodiazotropha taylori]MCG7944040.1 chemotaxis protein CheW [Candidatus Thiodiazotropha taylori]MCG7960434.1 chemotaxis protein CheW [Candidatus Thiodiazotropha taylori]MCG7968439.1 chemotaxis protein CheW [Candidatus Thiodiazotropha taylori]MCG7975886.1 chemotaxis protein CheW [Candidatus Thiodiazotropha taylori]
MSQAVVKEVRSVLIPLHERQILLPNATVAEVMGYQQPEYAGDELPEWFLGHLAWRGVMIPVVSYEGLLGEPVVEPGYRGRILILNALGDHERISHIGMAVHAIPSLVRVSADNVVPVNPQQDEPQPLIRQHVELDMSPAVIPDMDEIERQVLSVIEEL